MLNTAEAPGKVVALGGADCSAVVAVGSSGSADMKFSWENVAQHNEMEDQCVMDESVPEFEVMYFDVFETEQQMDL